MPISWWVVPHGLKSEDFQLIPLDEKARPLWGAGNNVCWLDCPHVRVTLWDPKPHSVQRLKLRLLSSTSTERQDVVLLIHPCLANKAHLPPRSSADRLGTDLRKSGPPPA